MGLSNRENAFELLARRSAGRTPVPLIADCPIDPRAFRWLQMAVALYMSRCLPIQETLTDEQALLAEFTKHRSMIRNMTPNGNLVPKRHLILEHNLVVKAFVEMVGTLGIGDFVDLWYVPLNVVYKYGDPVPATTSYRSTELVHSDAWAGTSADGVRMVIPIFGDTARNCDEYFYPPEDFSEDWLRPMPSYEDGAEIAKRYRRCEVPQRLGHVYLSDFAVMFRSVRTSDAGHRVTLEVTFAMKRSPEDVRLAEQKMHPLRTEERVTHQELCSVGLRKLFVFPDSTEDVVDSLGGFRHPSNTHLITILGETALEFDERNEIRP